MNESNSIVVLKQQVLELMAERAQLALLASNPDWILAPDNTWLSCQVKFFDREGNIHDTTSDEMDGECYLWVLPNPLREAKQ